MRMRRSKKPTKSARRRRMGGMNQTTICVLAVEKGRYEPRYERAFSRPFAPQAFFFSPAVSRFVAAARVFMRINITFYAPETRAHIGVRVVGARQRVRRRARRRARRRRRRSRRRSGDVGDRRGRWRGRQSRRRGGRRGGHRREWRCAWVGPFHSTPFRSIPFRSTPLHSIAGGDIAVGSPPSGRRRAISD